MSKKLSKMPPNRAGRRKTEIDKVRKIVEKQEIRRIGFDFPDKLICEFKIAVSMRREKNMTVVLKNYMTKYCDDLKKEKGLSELA